MAGRSYELDVTPGLSARLVLRVDGHQVHDSTSSDERRTIRLPSTGSTTESNRGPTAGTAAEPLPGEKKGLSLLPARRVDVRLSSMGKVKRATVHDGRDELDFDAPTGTRAARLQAWGREHPVLYALRFLAEKALVVVAVVLGLGALLRLLVEPLVQWLLGLLPDIAWPQIRLPDIPWPQIDLPDIPWPRIDLSWIPWPDPPPAWLLAVLEFYDRNSHIVTPLLVGVFLALGEMRRQRRQRTQRAAREAEELRLERVRLASALRALETRRAGHR